MTQISIGTKAGPASLSAPTQTGTPGAAPIPRPRGAVPGAAPQAAPMAAPVAIDEVMPPFRRSGGLRLSLALDAALALSLAVAAALLDALPLEVALVSAASWTALLLASGHYRRQALTEGRLARLGVVLATGLRALVISLAVSPWLTEVDPVALVALVAAFCVASGTHQLVVVRRHRSRVVLAGRPRDVREAMLELDAAGGHEVVAVCLTRESRVPFGDLPAYVGICGSASVAQRHQADAFVVLPGARLSATEVRRLHWALAGVGTELCVGTGLLDVTPDRTRVLAPGGLSLVHVAPASLHGPRRWVKDVLERSAAALALVLVLPFLTALGLLVRLETPGPALYRQQRVGRGGRPFTMYKLRSMSQSADVERRDLLGSNEADGVLFKIRQDPRVTPLGGLLRRWSLDEVPQLWNVVRGDMSLVGPRPALPQEVARYDVDPSRRLVVKPGLTGLWQVSGRSDLSWAESVRLDIRYVENWSLCLDLRILGRTVQAVLGRRGAY